MRTENYLQGLQGGLSIGLAYLAVSFTFGIAAAAQGLTAWEASLISLTNLTSAGQFAGLTVIATGGTYIEMVLTQLIINLRYFLMSCTLSQKMDPNESRLHRFPVAFGITDEIFALASMREGHTSAYFNYGAMSMAIPSWVVGTAAGALLGNILPDMIVKALAVAIYGMFVGIIIPPARRDRILRRVILGAMAFSALFTYAPVLRNISSGLTITITTVFISALAALLAPLPDEEKELADGKA